MDLTYHTDQTGGLCAIEGGIDAPFDILRVFTVSALKGSIRGEHAHKKCSQLFVAISGKMLLEVKTPTTSKTFSIDEKKKYGVLVPPKYWCSIKFIKKKSILMVMNDRKYEFKDYLETFNSYKKYLQKK